MNISSLSNASSSTGFLLQYTIKAQNQADIPVANNAGPPEKHTKNPLQPDIGTPDNMMAENFVQKDRQPSRYLQASLDSMQVLQNMQNRQNSILQTGKLEAATASTATEKYLASKRAARKIEEEKSAAVEENSEELLAKNKEEIEEKAEDAVMPTDENGNPIPKDESGDRVTTDAEGNPLPQPDDKLQAPDTSELAPETSVTPSVESPQKPPEIQATQSEVFDSAASSPSQVSAKGAKVDLLI